MGLDRKRFRALFDSERDGLYRFLHRLTGSREDAEDLVQDSFAAVWRKRSVYDGRGSLEGFLRRTAYRLFVNDWQKRQRRRRLAPAPMPERTEPAAVRGVAEDDMRRFLLAKIEGALAALPDPSREAFVLFRYEGWTARKIAEVTDTPVKTVETRLRRATKSLAETLAPYRHHLQAG